ncbi:hypothetical protein [Paenibacillus ginsengarvi]|nr:hypothetical protein [Paenibacillus ginsengarvi]
MVANDWVVANNSPRMLALMEQYGPERLLSDASAYIKGSLYTIDGGIRI